ncbi:hypothetical protein RAS1_39850 [Phycisphaerae bacterium RAS1]|nr:hypothetical protein RAS1_39850 [Phycisphaerae bacterium RAS1]
MWRHFSCATVLFVACGASCPSEITLPTINVPVSGDIPESERPATNDNDSANDQNADSDGGSGLVKGLYSGTLTFDVTITATGIFIKGDPARLDVNDPLRRACVGYADRDADINSLIEAVEADRLNGYSKADEVNTAATICVGPFPDLNVACASCNIAIIDQVFSIESTSQERTTEASTLEQTLLVNSDGSPSDVTTLTSTGIFRFNIVATQLEKQDGIVVVKYDFEIDLLDTSTEEVVVTFPGQGIDTFEQTGENSITYRGTVNAGYSSQVGAFQMAVAGRGILGR